VARASTDVPVTHGLGIARGERYRRGISRPSRRAPSVHTSEQHRFVRPITVDRKYSSHAARGQYQPGGPMPANSSKTTVNHNQIRRWAEARHAHPARVKGTGRGGDPGMIRLDFPNFSGPGKLEEISWDQWFDAFDHNGLALVYQEKTASGKRSNFNKLIGRETAQARGRGASHVSRHKSARGSEASRSGTSRSSTSRSGTSRSGTSRSGASRASTSREGGRRGSSPRSSKARVH
jgi:hypothetical protein